jgi:hypothetical protein
VGVFSLFVAAVQCGRSTFSLLIFPVAIFDSREGGVYIPYICVDVDGEREKERERDVAIFYAPFFLVLSFFFFQFFLYKKNTFLSGSSSKNHTGRTMTFTPLISPAAISQYLGKQCGRSVFAGRAREFLCTTNYSSRMIGRGSLCSL